MPSSTETNVTGARPLMVGGEDHAAGAQGSRADASVDAVLVRRVRRGDYDAYGELVRRHSRRAYSIAYGVLQHRQDAEDVVQDAFARALERIDDVDTSRPFHPWFYRVVMNTAISFQRARHTRRTGELHEHTRSAAAGPDALAERGALRSLLLRALDTLPDRQRAIVLLADVEELSSSEIGEILQLPAGTVRYQLHLARRALREVLSAADEEAR
jgi:RNA polymerase sigma-70 factor, ECF subfamily